MLDSPAMTMERSEDGTIKLKLQDAKLEDTGEYRCELSNVHGVTWSDATLNIQGKVPSENETGENYR